MSERKQLIEDEGLMLKPYKCTGGKITIGFGRNLQDNPLSICEIQDLLYARPHINSREKDVGEIRDMLLKDFYISGITRGEAMMLLDNDIKRIGDELTRRLPWYSAAPKEVRGILLNMAFNLGVGGLLGFKQTLPLIEAGFYEAAADNLQKSRWAVQVPNRAGRLIERLKNIK